MSTLFYRILYCSLFFLLSIFLYTSIPVVKLKIFNLTHSNWTEVKDFQILKSEINCSSPWGRGGDKQATLEVSYKYNYRDQDYSSEKKEFYSVYKMYIFEHCSSLKEKSEDIFDEAIRTQSMQLWVKDNSPNKSELFLENKEFNYRLSWLSIFFSEIQGIILALVLLIIVYSVYTLLSQKNS